MHMNITVTMDSPPSTPPPRRSDGELILGRRYAIAMDIAMAILPGKSKIPKGFRWARSANDRVFVVASTHISCVEKSQKPQIDATQEVDLSTQKMSG